MTLTPARPGSTDAARDPQGTSSSLSTSELKRKIVIVNAFPTITTKDNIKNGAQDFQNIKKPSMSGISVKREPVLVGKGQMDRSWWK